MTASKQLVWTRCLVLLLSVVSALLALDPPGDILQITIFSGSLYAVCFLPAVVLGLYWAKGSGLAVLTSMAAGVAMLLVWLSLGYGVFLHEVFPALAVSTSVYVFVALLQEQRANLSLLFEER